MDEPPRKRMVRPPAGGGDGRAPAQRLKTAKLRTASELSNDQCAIPAPGEAHHRAP